MSMGIFLGSRPRSVSTLKPAALPQAFQLGATRIPNEFYPTPPEATRALLSVETFDGSIWEPACGEGAIASVLADAGQKVVATDLVDYGYGIPRVDFLKETRPRAKHIVTNPPYGVRLSTGEALQDWYPQVGDLLKQRFAGWHCYFLSADMELAKRIGLKASKRTPLMNGDLDCRLFEYKVVAGQNRGRQSAPADEVDEQ